MFLHERYKDELTDDVREYMSDRFAEVGLDVRRYALYCSFQPWVPEYVPQNITRMWGFGNPPIATLCDEEKLYALRGVGNALETGYLKLRPVDKINHAWFCGQTGHGINILLLRPLTQCKTLRPLMESLRSTLLKELEEIVEASFEEHVRQANWTSYA